MTIQITNKIDDGTYYFTVDGSDYYASKFGNNWALEQVFARKTSGGFPLVRDISRIRQPKHYERVIAVLNSAI